MNNRRAMFILMLAAIAFFFWREFHAHWERFSDMHFMVRWPYLLLGGVTVCATQLVATWSWRESIRVVTGDRLTFRESFGVFNASQPAKYIPGKVWSYGLQMYWLSLRGIPKTSIASANLVMTLSVIALEAVCGLAYLAFTDIVLPEGLAIGLFISASLGYFILVFRGAGSVNFAFTIMNRVFRKPFHAMRIRSMDMVAIQGWYLLLNILFGLSGYFIALAIGESWNSGSIFPVAAALLFSDAIGSIVVIAPGGVGVRELVMYGILDKVVETQAALMLPLAIRIFTMGADLVIGTFALWYVQRFLQISVSKLTREPDSALSLLK